MRRGFVDQTLGEITCEGQVRSTDPIFVNKSHTLNTANHVMTARIRPFTDSTEKMVFFYRGATDTAKETLLHTTLEFNDGDFGRRLDDVVHIRAVIYRAGTRTYKLNLDGHPANKEPR